VPKKKEVLAAPLEGIEQSSTMIGSMEVSINEIKEPIVIGN
jgi:hypothetical protein